MLLSIDWDYYAGAVEHVFDGPLWGTRDRDEDRVLAWQRRALSREPGATGWDVLTAEFPLLGDPDELLAYAGCPTSVSWTHADAWPWLQAHPERDVVNLDSHHDLYSRSGDPARVRPGNWAGLALASGLARTYRCTYPAWHADTRVAEGFDLDRTQGELAGRLAPEVLARVTLARGELLPDPGDVEAVLLVLSPSWSNPAHDARFHEISRRLGARELAPVPSRPWPG